MQISLPLLVLFCSGCSHGCTRPASDKLQITKTHVKLPDGTMISIGDGGLGNFGADENSYGTLRSTAAVVLDADVSILVLRQMLRGLARSGVPSVRLRCEPSAEGVVVGTGPSASRQECLEGGACLSAQLIVAAGREGFALQGEHFKHALMMSIPAIEGELDFARLLSAVSAIRAKEGAFEMIVVIGDAQEPMDALCRTLGTVAPLASHVEIATF